MMDGVTHKLREWGVALLAAIVIFAAFAAPAVVIQSETRHTNEKLAIMEELLHDHDQQLVEAQERTIRATAALVNGIACILTIDIEDRKPAVIKACIEDALLAEGFTVSGQEPAVLEPA
jgi:hypothetical protein